MKFQILLRAVKEVLSEPNGGGLSFGRCRQPRGSHRRKSPNARNKRHR
jgi:hypothetical protein